MAKVHNPDLGKEALADFHARIAAVREKHPGAIGGIFSKDNGTVECGVCRKPILRGADFKWKHQ